MNIYVAHVRTGGEATFLAQARQTVELETVEFLWPRRKLTIRRAGRRKETLAPVFPGYVFVKAKEISTNVFVHLKQIPSFFRFLESNENIRPLSGRDYELVSHFLRFGEVVGKSEVTFDENSRIQVLEGPLVGLEGSIVAVDRRKRRAKVKLDLYSNSFLVDFGFEIITAAEKKPG